MTNYGLRIKGDRALGTHDLPGLYLQMMRAALTNDLYPEAELARRRPGGLFKWLFPLIARKDEFLASVRDIPTGDRWRGTIWPPPQHAYTLIGGARLRNIQFCVENVLREGIEGDLMECGVWKGGAVIYMMAVLAAHGNTKRRVWVADSFQGLPKPEREEDRGDKHHTYTELAVPLTAVMANFQRFGLLTDQVRFLEGWFKETLPRAQIIGLDKLAVLRIDCDLYGSTMDALENMYPRLELGGYCIIDDYCLPPCRRAVLDYRKLYNIGDVILNIDGSGVFWKKQNDPIAKPKPSRSSTVF